MKNVVDVAIVGGGIVGLAHAWMAARRGLSVMIFERTQRAQAATVRNFGMVWPIGQPAGEAYDIALRSRDLWLQLDQAGVLHADRCGALHLAHHEDELAVLEEFQSLGTHQCELLTPLKTLAKAPIANPKNLQGALFSPTELRVDPRTTADAISAWLAAQYDVHRQYQTSITEISSGELMAADGRRWQANKIVICCGSDFSTLFPELFATSGLRLCKLQMLRTVAQDPCVIQAAHVASGLTLRHYRSFQACPSLDRVRRRVATEDPDLDRYGIHVMATQTAQGEFILGDSHEYDDDISPFDIDDLILRELRAIIQLPNWTIKERWHGIYARHPDLPIFAAEPRKDVHVCVGPGGAGMTMAFGLADQSWRQWTAS